MLITDGQPVSLTDLISIESAIATDTTREGVTVFGPNSVGQRTINDAISRLLALLVQYESYPNANGTELSANHLAAVFNMGPGPRNMPRFKPQQITCQSQIANLWSPIKTWLAHMTLVEIYQTLWNRKLKEDRYEAKLRQYKELIMFETWPRFKSQGMPIVMSPLSAPAALFDFNSGTWGSENVTLVSAGEAIGGAITVAVTYVDQVSQSNTYLSPAMPGNAESASSIPMVVTVPAGQALQFSIGTLKPPTGAPPPTGFAQGWLTPRTATGWNIYAGIAPAPLTLQTIVPIPITTLSFTLPGDPVVGVYPLGDGQYADFNHVMASLIFRG